MKSLTVLCLLVLAAFAFGVKGEAGAYRFEVKSEPEVIPVGKAKLKISVTDKAGRSVSKAVVKVLAQMPGMPMGERETLATPVEYPGNYETTAVFGMAGSYDIRVSINGSQGIGAGTVSVSTGQSVASDGSMSFVARALIAAALFGAVGIFLAIAVKGSFKNWRSIFSVQVIVSLVLLSVALGAVIWAVNTFRRPGAMTPLEAQVMEMNVPAPDGTLPVELEPVTSKTFSSASTYSGQAVAFVEQDVVARVSGTLVWMPTYVGAKVKKGEILARLDTSQTDPMVREKTAQSAAAGHGINIAQSDYQRSIADVSQAQAEQAIRVGAIDEAAAMVIASKQDVASAEANLKLEQASILDAKAQVASMQADRDYWNQEMERSRQLFAKGAISKDELQKTQSATLSASAKVRQAQAGVDVANAKVGAARAALGKATAGVSAAQSKLQEMQAEHHSHMAHVRSAEASSRSALNRVKQAEAEQTMASAGLEGASVQRDYSILKSEVDGIVSARLISPGVLVAPGQAILKIAQVSPVRLQANVPQEKLSKFHVGSKVMIKIGNRELVLAVSSVSPSVDTTSRMGVVEAIYANSGTSIFPGQIVSMSISTDDDHPQIVVPSDAMQLDNGKAFVWVAEPSSNNEFVASRVEIQVSGDSDGWTAVLSGVHSGQQVVRRPSTDLTAGTRLTNQSIEKQLSSKPALDVQNVDITAAGYDPPSISVPAGRPFRLIFTRRDDKTCGTEVIFPDLGIRKTLPLNQPVAVDIPIQPAGKILHFTCPMNMLNGKAVAR